MGSEMCIRDSLDTNMENVSEDISTAVKNSKVWALEVILKIVFPYCLALALAIRFTMTSAEVFNWYRS